MISKYANSGYYCNEHGPSKTLCYYYEYEFRRYVSLCPCCAAKHNYKKAAKNSYKKVEN